jgi:hypothetical protein
LTLLDPAEPSLVSLADIRALLYLNHLDLFEHLEAMASLDQQDHIAGVQDTAFKIALIRVVEVDPEPSFPDEQDLLRKLHFPRHGVMNMGLDELSGGVPHERQLLRQCVVREEMDALFAKLAADNHRQEIRAAENALDIAHHLGLAPLGPIVLEPFTKSPVYFTLRIPPVIPRAIEETIWPVVMRGHPDLEYITIDDDLER